MSASTIPSEAPKDERPPPTALADEEMTVIEPRSGWRSLDFGEMLKFRELLAFLVWRDVAVRYKQTVLGGIWAVLQPMATMLVFTLFLGRLAGRIGADRAGSGPYPLFLFAGLLAWMFLGNSVVTASGSVLSHQNLITKVYFPRIFIPLAATGAYFVDFLVAFVALLGMMVLYRTPPGWTVIAAPGIVALLVVLAVGVGTLLAALTVAYRDFRHVVPYGVQLWMFATPTIYLPDEVLVGGPASGALLLNPAYGLILNFRRTMLGGSLDWVSLSFATALSIGFFLVGGAYFRRVERTFADVI